jgi:glycosyltransferase involved in cell wall biosynthesis
MSLSVLHVLPGLGYGGTEFVVSRLAQAERALGFQNQVIYLKGQAPLAEDLRKGGVPCHRMNAMTTLSALAGFFPPGRGKKLPFDIVHGWLYSGNLTAGVLAGGGRRAPVIWNLMQGNLGPEVNSAKIRAYMKIGAHYSSRWPSKIVCNSLLAQKAHEKIGYDPSRMTVIPNGIDTNTFRPNPAARAQFREKYSLSNQTLVIGHLARWDPNKDHRTLLSAFGLVARRGVNAHLFLAGPGVTEQNSVLMEWVRQTGVVARVHLLGPVEDTPSFLAGLDLFCLSSIGESSSYALAEAMACGIPAVSSDVGDARDVVGATGAIVPPAHPQVFSDGIQRLASMQSAERARLGIAARERIVKNYSFKTMVDAYQSLYRAVLGKDSQS